MNIDSLIEQFEREVYIYQENKFEDDFLEKETSERLTNIIFQIETIEQNMDIEDTLYYNYQLKKINEILMNSSEKSCEVQRLSSYINSFLNSFIDRREEEPHKVIRDVFNCFLDEIKKYMKNHIFDSDKLEYLDYIENHFNSYYLKYRDSLSPSIRENLLKEIKDFIKYNKRTIRRNQIVKSYLQNVSYTLGNLEKDKLSLDRNIMYSDIIINTRWPIYKEQMLITKYKGNRALVIDGKDAERLDDAISIRKIDNNSYEIGIHIIDPFMYYDLDKNMIGLSKKDQSIFLKNRNNIANYNEPFKRKILSFAGCHNHLVNSYYLKVSRDGITEPIIFKKEMMRHVDVKVMTYEEYDDIVKGKVMEDVDVYKTVEMLEEIKPLLDKNFNKNITSYVYKSLKKEPHSQNSDSPGNKIVSVSMLTINNLLAEYFYKMNYPYIYKNQEASDEFKILLEQIGSCPSEEEIKSLALIYKDSEYSTTCLGHYGLGMHAYGNMTSPIIKPYDLVNNYLIDNCIHQEASDERIKELENITKRYVKR